MPPPAIVNKPVAPTTSVTYVEEKGCYACRVPNCQAAFTARSALAYHTAAEHQYEAEVTVMGWDGAWKVQRRRTHSNGEVSADGFFHCPKCARPYKSPASLKVHTGKCEESKPQPGDDESHPPEVTMELIRTRRKEKEEDATRTFEMPNCNQTTPWAKRSRFLLLLNGQRLEDYAAAADLPQKHTEQGEVAICDLTADAIRDAADGLNSVCISYAQLMNATDVSKTHMTRPMNAKPTTLDGYIKIAQRLVLFCVRVQLAGTDTTQYGDTNAGEELPPTLGKARKAMLGDPILREMVCRLMANPEKKVI
ncbi:hypothetical protein A4X13_0g9611, partial [Tilletia indica]